MTPPDREEDEKAKRTTIRLPVPLYDAMLAAADSHGKSLNQEIIDALWFHVTKPSFELEAASRRQMLDFVTGTIAGLSAFPPPVKGFTSAEVEAVLDALVEMLRGRHQGQT